MNQESARKATRRIGALALLFFGAVVWKGVVSDDSGRLLEDDGVFTEEPEDNEQAFNFGAPSRQLDSKICTCMEDREDIGMLFCSWDHLTKREAQYNSICRQGETVCIKEGSRWMIVLYVLGIVYMFMALAIVCDEFFVPSLECFCEEFDVSMDVAGATFMAAGGSMPELFTSAIGTIRGTSIGIAAIVGSAVFNVLFVIATCAVASDTVLELTWWPLARDCSYYMMTLITLALFFSGDWSRESIELWEAIVMFIMYLGYCVVMKNNSRLQRFFTRGSKVAPAPDKKEAVEEGWAEPRSNPSSSDESGEQDKINASFLQPSTFRKGIVQLLIQNEQITDTVGMAAVVKLKGNLRQTFDHIDKDQNGHLDEAEFKQMLEEMGLSPDSASMDTAMRSIGRNADGQIGFKEFERWYLASEARIEIKMRRIFDKFDSNENGLIEFDEVWEILKSLGHKCKESDVLAAMEQMLSSGPSQAADDDSVKPEEVNNGDLRPPPGAPTALLARGDVSISDLDQPVPPSKSAGEPQEVGVRVRFQEPQSLRSSDVKSASVSFEDFSRWYMNSLFWKEQEKQCKAEEDGMEGTFTIDMPVGATRTAKIWYAATYPLCSAMYVTMPDVRNPKVRSVPMAIVEFIFSLVWIGVFSLSMVEWTEVVSNTIGIPIPVAGITVLAAGTSIPDLLSSYIVAKRGEGDMAVSSSIGSNIFDVTVGLPLPWIIWSIANGGAPVRVDARGIGFFISILVLMIAAVVGTIMLMKWRMTKPLGYVMFFLYFLFITLFLLVEMPEGNPAMSPPF